MPNLQPLSFETFKINRVEIETAKNIILHLVLSHLT